MVGYFLCWVKLYCGKIIFSVVILVLCVIFVRIDVVLIFGMWLLFFIIVIVGIGNFGQWLLLINIYFGVICSLVMVCCIVSMVV